MMRTAGTRSSARSRMKGKFRRRIHHACLDNLRHLLEGELKFDEWALCQEELESQLGPEPELPFTQLVSKSEDPRHPVTP